MLKFSGFHLKKTALLNVAVLVLAMIAIDASAQSEIEKGNENQSKANDRAILDDNVSVHDYTPAPSMSTKPNTASPKSTAVVKRDLPAGGVMIEKEAKRTESPSTLSFNIFLYIVDKFKAD